MPCLTEITAKLDELHELNDEIPDAQLSYEMDRMEKAGRSIAESGRTGSRKRQSRSTVLPAIICRKL